MISSVIWISSNEARLVRFVPGQLQERHFHSHDSHKGKYENAEHASKLFFADVAKAATQGNQDRYLVVGPGQAKLHFIDYLKGHHPQAAARIAGVESVDKMTEGELADFSHRFFKKIDTFEKLG